MNRKLGLFLAISFLTMQVLSTLHLAEYGFDKHEHNGHICEIYLHSEHTKYSAAEGIATIQVSEYATFTPAIPELNIFRSGGYSTSSPRAPPFFS